MEITILPDVIKMVTCLETGGIWINGVRYIPTSKAVIKKGKQTIKYIID